MRAALAILCAIAFTGCADMTPTQKKWTVVAVSVVATGAILAHQADHGGGSMGPQAVATASKSSCAFSAGAQFCAGQPRGK